MTVHQDVGAASPSIGLLYPGFGAEDDFATLQARLVDRVRLPLVHTSVGEDAHRIDALLELGNADRLAEGASRLIEHDPDAVMWACTSGSFVFGWDGAHQQVDQLSELLNIPVSSTSLAFVQACAALGIKRVSVAASYPQDVAQRFVQFLACGGVEVTHWASHGIYTAAEVGRLGKQQILAMAREVDVTTAEAILIPDTAMHSLAWVGDLETRLGKPVLTANQVTIWDGLRIAHAAPVLPGLGSLLSATTDSSKVEAARETPSR